MITVERGGYCKHCKEQVRVFRRAPNHILHLILTLLTFGLWIIVWLGVSVSFGGWRCCRCGSTCVKQIH